MHKMFTPKGSLLILFQPLKQRFQSQFQNKFKMYIIQPMSFEKHITCTFQSPQFYTNKQKMVANVIFSKHDHKFTQAHRGSNTYRKHYSPHIILCMLHGMAKFLKLPKFYFEFKIFCCFATFKAHLIPKNSNQIKHVNIPSCNFH